MPKKGPQENKAPREMDAATLANLMHKVLKRQPSHLFSIEDLTWETGMQTNASKHLVHDALDYLLDHKLADHIDDGFQLALDPEDVLIYTQDNAELLMKNSGDFDTWVTETVSELENFTGNK